MNTQQQLSKPGKPKVKRKHKKLAEQALGSVQYVNERNAEYAELGVNKEQETRIKDILQKFSQWIKKSSIDIKVLILKLARNLEEAGCPVGKICDLICKTVKKAKGFVSSGYIRIILPEMYKEDYRIKNAKKRMDKLELEKQKAIDKRKRDLLGKDASQYTVEDIKQVQDMELLREIAIFWRAKAEV